MNAMEQMAVSMLAKMTGLGPEEMQAMAAKGMSILQTVETRMDNMEKKLDLILAYLESDMVEPTLTKLEISNAPGNTPS